MTEKILFVDDDINVLEGFKRQLRKHFMIETTSSGEAGLAAMRSGGPYAVVVSDMRMPGMTGVQFLGQARQQAPDTVRLLLTGQADMASAIAAINEGAIFRFLTKPCLPDVLVPALQAALQQHQLITAERTLLEQTLSGSVKVLTDVLALVNLAAFGRASRLKRYAHHIATHLELADVWQFELAATLSQLGCVTLAGDTLEKISTGDRLSADEEKLFAKHPSVGAELLRHIPRLEAVAAMIARQHDPSADPRDLHALRQRDDVLLGAHILKVILHFDHLLNRGFSHHDAMAELRKQPDPYGIVCALQDLPVNEADAVMRLVTVRELSPGMMLGEDIRSTTGVLVLAKGHEVTKVMIERLYSYTQRVAIVEPFRVLVPRHG